MEKQIIEMPFIYEGQATLKGKRKPAQVFILDFIPFEVPVFKSSEIPIAASVQRIGGTTQDYRVIDDSYITQYRGIENNGINVDKKNMLISKEYILNYLNQKNKTINILYGNKRTAIGFKNKDGNLVTEDEYQMSKKISDNRKACLMELKKRMEHACIIRKPDGTTEIFIGTKGLELILKPYGANTFSILKQDQDDPTFKIYDALLSKEIVLGLKGWQHRHDIIETLHQRGFNFQLNDINQVHQTEIFDDNRIPDDININVDTLLNLIFNKSSDFLPYMSPKTLGILTALAEYRDIYNISPNDIPAKDSIFLLAEKFSESLLEDIPHNMTGHIKEIELLQLKAAIANEYNHINKSTCDYNLAP